jgi:hypothetical protein
MQGVNPGLNPGLGVLRCGHRTRDIVIKTIFSTTTKKL